MPPLFDLVEEPLDQIACAERHGLKQIGSLRFRRQLLSLVCYRRQPGKYVLNSKFTAFDPKRPFTTTLVPRMAITRFRL